MSTWHLRVKFILTTGLEGTVILPYICLALSRFPGFSHMHDFTPVAPSLTLWEPHLLLVRWCNSVVNQFTWVLSGRVRTQTLVCLTPGPVLCQLLECDSERIAWVGVGGLFRERSSEEEAGSPNDPRTIDVFWSVVLLGSAPLQWELLCSASHGNCWPRESLFYSTPLHVESKSFQTNYFSLLILQVLDILFWNVKKDLHGVGRAQALESETCDFETSTLTLASCMT